jgi:hypothetical protein
MVEVDTDEDLTGHAYRWGLSEGTDDTQGHQVHPRRMVFDHVGRDPRADGGSAEAWRPQTPRSQGETT